MDRQLRTQFAQAYAADAAFRTRVEAATSAEELVRLANDKGIPLSTEDVIGGRGSDTELDDSQLDAASGGTAWVFDAQTWAP